MNSGADRDPPGAGGYWYVDKTTGRRSDFRPKVGEAVLALGPDRPGRPRQVLRDVLAASSVRSVSRFRNLDDGYAAIYVSADRPADAELRELHVAALPVMIDGEGLERYFLPTEFCVQFAGDVGEDEIRRIVAEHECSIVNQQRTPGYVTLGTPESADVFPLIRQFTERADVVFAEPSEIGFDDALVHLPNDPRFDELWGLHNVGQAVNGTTGSADIDLDAPSAWDLTRGNGAVIVAVIDTGADLDHDDLRPNILRRGGDDWDFADSADDVPEDGDGHGTHVAGTVAAAENSFGVVGVAPSCSIMPLRINLQSGKNQNRADAINYVASRSSPLGSQRYVINCSWRMSGDHAGVRLAIGNAVANNVLVVFAAGNSNQNTDVTPEYPGVYPNVLAVAAIDQRGRRASFSNFGRNVDMAAPGVNILSSLLDNSHGFLNGTSMAAPHVAGIAALVWSAVPGLTNGQVRTVVEATCDAIDHLNPGFEGQLGAGRVNARRAVTLAQFMGHYLPAMAPML